MPSFQSSIKLMAKVVEIASSDFIALAMTSQESHCESAVADAAVSVHITHEGIGFLRSVLAEARG